MENLRQREIIKAQAAVSNPGKEQGSKAIPMYIFTAEPNKIYKFDPNTLEMTEVEILVSFCV